jgi:hypothetical protein
MTQSPNPLKAFFRQPAIYLKLPSNGAYWPDSSIEFPQNRELPVYPMTAVDEITYRTPDALFSGQSVVNVIESCVPNIKNAWAAPFVDINSILIGIRIASYGHSMEVGTACPACNHQEEFELDLRHVLDQMHSPDYAKTIVSGDLEIIFCPMSYEQQNTINLEQFELQRTIQMIPVSDLPEEEKILRMADIMKKLTELTLKAITLSIAAVRTPTAMVTEVEHIAEFLNNCDRTIFGVMRDHAIELRQAGELNPLKLKCSECENEYEQQLTLDMANFFAPAS